MDKTEKRRSKQPVAPSNSIIAKYRHDDDGDDGKADQWRKYRQGRNLPAYHDRNERRQSNPPIDTMMGYHYPADLSRPRKHHVSSSNASRTKYQIPSVPEEAHRAGDKNHGILTALKCYPNNYAVVRKSRYKDDEDDESKYVDGDPVDDNPEEETGEEIVDEEHENLSEYSDKDYEEQEADDEVDEESDVFEPQVERFKTQRKSRMDPPMRTQKTSNIEPSHYHHEQKIGIEKNPQRCCHVADERDDIDVPTEDDEDRHDLCDGTTCLAKKTTWRYHGHQGKESRTLPRNVAERYSNCNKTTSGSAHQNRRPRTTKPEMEYPIITLERAHHGPIRNNRCSKCGVLTGQKPKTTSSRNASCRLQDSRHFTRIPIGDEGEYFEDPEPTFSYQTKPRRSKESKSPDYDPREESRTLDAELGAIYKSCRTKIPRDLINGNGERKRHSARVNNRHEPLPPSKNENHYWK